LWSEGPLPASDGDSFQPLVFVLGVAGLALMGFAGTAYFWHLNWQMKRAFLVEKAELRKQLDSATRTDREVQRCKSESDILRKQMTDWRREAELLCKERDDALGELRRANSKATAAAEERDGFKASARAAEKAAKDAEKAAKEAQAPKASPQVSPQASPRGGADTLYKEIDAAMKKLQKVPLATRASELRVLKRSYHPDAQKLKSPAVQQLFTELSQHVNSFCEAHLRRDCPVCKSTRNASV